MLVVVPGDGATNVARATSVQVRFNEEMNTASVEAAFSCRKQGAFVGRSGTFVWSVGDTVLTFTPSTLLDADATFLVAITTGAQSSAGVGAVAMTAPFSSSFATAPDPVPAIEPQVVSISPAAGATDVDPMTVVVVTFNTQMERSTAEGAFKVQGQGQFLPKAGAFSWSAGDTVMTFTPFSLNASTLFTVTISTAATASALAGGRPMAAQFSSTFTTEAPPAPLTAQLNVTPASGVAPLDVFMDARQSSGDNPITQYEFFPGDLTGSIVGPDPTADHTYAAAGSYVPRVEVTDSAAATDDATDTVVVSSSSAIPIPPSIEDDFSVNVTNKLANFLDGIPDGTLANPKVITAAPGARYRLDGQFRWINRKHFVLTCPAGTPLPIFSGEGVVYDEAATPTTAERTRCQFFFEDCEDIAFRRIRAEGSNRSYHYAVNLEAQAAFWLAGSKRMEFDRCEAEWIYGDFLFTGRGSDNVTVNDGIWAHDCTIRHIGRGMLTPHSAKNVLWERQHGYEAKRFIMDIEPNSNLDRAEFIYMQDSTYEAGAIANHYAVGGTGHGAPVHDVVVRRNHFKGVMGFTFGLMLSDYRRNRAFVSQNVSDGTTNGGEPPIQFINADEVYARANTERIRTKATLGAKYALVRLHQACGSNVGGNTVLAADSPPNTPAQTQVTSGCPRVGVPVPSGVPNPPAVWPFVR